MCFYDEKAQKCRSCLTNPSGPGCLRTSEFLPADVSSMNAGSAKGLDSLCEDWATMVSGQVAIGGGNVTSADCPNGGCVGFAFRLPQGFAPQPYETLEKNLKLSRCFLASAWTGDALVQRKKGPQALDPLCGAPQMRTPDQEFCTDSTLDLTAEKDGVLTEALPAEDGADDPALVVAGAEAAEAATEDGLAAVLGGGAGAVRSVVAFDDAAVDSFIAGGAFSRATLELTVLDAQDGEAHLVDAHPLLQDFADPDEDAAGGDAPLVATAAGGGPKVVRRVLGSVDRRVPVLDRSPGGGVGGGGPDPEQQGVTWACAYELDPSDDVIECSVKWATPGGDYGAATAAPATAGGDPGTVVAWDVTADVQAGITRWLLRNRDESDPSSAAFHSQEGAEAAGDEDLAPRLVLE
jgi:hypothetical protein